MKIALTGSKKDGYILKLYNPVDSFKWDVALDITELLEIQKLLNKKFK